MAVDQSGEQGLAATVVYLGLLVLLHHLVVRPDRRDAAALDGKRDAVPDFVNCNDGGVGEDDGSSLGCLRLADVGVEGEGRGGGAGAGEQFATIEGRGCHGAEP